MLRLSRCAVAICLLACAGCSRGSAPTVVKPSPTFKPGSIVTFDVQSYVGNTTTDIDEIEKLSIANDVRGMTDLLLARGARVFIANGQLRVIETVGRHTRVRATDGAYEGRDGWTITEWLKQSQ